MQPIDLDFFVFVFFDANNSYKDNKTNRGQNNNYNPGST
jgi:hypothetical protein